jgi:hypothetical protein
MHERIRRLEHRAEQLAIRLETLAEQPDITRIAMTGVFCAAAISWFAVAWGEGLLLLGIPIVAGVCVVLVRRREQHDPADSEDMATASPERKEIDEWLTKLVSSPARPDPAPPRAGFAAPAVSFSLPAPPAAPIAEASPVPDLPQDDLPVGPIAEQDAPADPEEGTEPTAIYEIREIRAGAPILLEVRATFDGAVDVAFELIEERDPPELEIVHVRGDERETAWSYSREAAENQPRGTLELFGFDATRWTDARR